MSRVCFGEEQDRTTGEWFCPRGNDPYDCRLCYEGYLHNADLHSDDREASE